MAKKQTTKRTIKSPPAKPTAHELIEDVGRCIVDLNASLAKLKGERIRIHIQVALEDGTDPYCVPTVGWSFNREAKKES